MASDWAKAIVPTFHPSAILRAPDRNERRRMRQLLTQNLRLAIDSARS
jgi:hypothetical protein